MFQLFHYTKKILGSCLTLNITLPKAIQFAVNNLIEHSVIPQIKKILELLNEWGRYSTSVPNSKHKLFCPVFRNVLWYCICTEPRPLKTQAITINYIAYVIRNIFPTWCFQSKVHKIEQRINFGKDSLFLTIDNHTFYFVLNPRFFKKFSC